MSASDYDYQSVKESDWLIPDPLWNSTERPPNQLPPACRVDGVIAAQSETGILFHVKTNSGASRWLDAGWFIGRAG